MVTMDNGNGGGEKNDNRAQALHIKEEEDHHGRIGLQVIFAIVI
jgi:hypothetical protein